MYSFDNVFYFFNKNTLKCIVLAMFFIFFNKNTLKYIVLAILLFF
jgi:hypothetical protein